MLNLAIARLISHASLTANLIASLIRSTNSRNQPRLEVASLMIDAKRVRLIRNIGTARPRLLRSFLHGTEHRNNAIVIFSNCEKALG